MKQASLLIIKALVLFLPFSAFAQDVGSADKAAIRTIVRYYFDGHSNDNVESMKKAFHPNAKMFFKMSDGGLREVTYQTIFANMEQNTKNGIDKFRRVSTLRILTLDVTGDAASVKAVFEDKEIYLGSTKTLGEPERMKKTVFLSLIKFDNAWKIVTNVISLGELITAPSSPKKNGRSRR